MSPRSIRRAIERKAQKQARKQEIQTAAPSLVGASESQFLANQRNAQLSKGPKTPEGKAISSRNALKTGLTGKTVLLPNDDANLYQQHVDSFRSELKPVGDRECALVQSIADAKWRLARIPSLEFGIYALGSMQFGDEFAQLPPAEAAALIEAKTFLTYQRQLNNLSIQETRLRRQCEKDSAELARLQQLRSEIERLADRKAAATISHHAAANGIGFEFETPSDVTREIGFDRAPDCLTLPQAA